MTPTIRDLIQRELEKVDSAVVQCEFAIDAAQREVDTLKDLLSVLNAKKSEFLTALAAE
jgi:hypothetical protein